MFNSAATLLAFVEFVRITTEASEILVLLILTGSVISMVLGIHRPIQRLRPRVAKR